MRNHFASACCCPARCWLVRPQVRAPVPVRAVPPLRAALANDSSPRDPGPARLRAAAPRSSLDSAPLPHHLPTEHEVRRVRFIFPSAYGREGLGHAGARRPAGGRAAGCRAGLGWQHSMWGGHLATSQQAFLRAHRGFHHAFAGRPAPSSCLHSPLHPRCQSPGARGDAASIGAETRLL